MTWALHGPSPFISKLMDVVFNLLIFFLVATTIVKPVRQLRNAVERAVVMSDGEVLLPRHLPAELLATAGDEPAQPEPRAVQSLAEMERAMIRRALRETGRNYSLAAGMLGIHRNTLRRKIAEYGL